MRTFVLRIVVWCALAGLLASCGFFEASEGSCQADDAVCKPQKLDNGSRDAQVDDAASTRELDGAIDAAHETGASDASDGDDAGSVQDGSQLEPGPCGLCPRRTPACDPETLRCEQCVTAGDCASDEVCSDEHKCVACNVDADCKDEGKSRCVSYACEPCTLPAHCIHIGDKPVCDQGECVQCTGGSYAACGQDDLGRARVCDSKARRCTEELAGQAGTCARCVSDAQCGTGLGCVEQVFGATTLPARCFPADTGVCADASLALRPFSEPAMVETLDAPAAAHCLPITTCQAYLDAAMQKPCDTSDECGEQGIEDGFCVDDSCTYAGCTQDYQCPALGPSDCSTSLCRP
jgi:hypothetical protein